jgi:bifunctional ADP-heptose synthase (sugar kinase/adenylyltransferase)
MRDLKSTVKQLIVELHKRVDAQRITITQGRKGCTVSDKEGCSKDIPALAKKIIDRIGSGDALLAITSLAAALGVEKEMIGFLGNVAGALAVEIMGNKKAIDKESLKYFIQSLYRTPGQCYA